jgi:hypothetical protein
MFGSSAVSVALTGIATALVLLSAFSTSAFSALDPTKEPQ